MITDVQPTPATTPDDGMVPVGHAALAARALLPAEHLVDKGYTAAATLLESERDRGVRRVGPVAADPSWEVRFARRDCTPCPSRALCTRAARDPRALTLLPRDQYEALHAVQRAQTTAAFRAAYAARAGIESTPAQAIRRAGLRHCRYLGLAKTRLQHVVTAVALNVVRVTAWAAGTPLAPPRRPAFARLPAAA